MLNSSSFNGPSMVLAAAIGFGFNPMFAQILYSQGFAAEMVSLYRFILQAILLSFYLRTPRCEWSESLRMMLLGIVSGVAVFSYFYALNSISVATAVLIYYTYPLFSVLVGWVVFRRQPTMNALMSAALVLVAISLVVDLDTLSSSAKWTVLMCFLAPLVFAIQIQYLSKPMCSMPIVRRMGWSTMGHVAVLLPVAIWLAPVMVLPDSWVGLWAILGLSILAAALPQLLFLIGVPKTAPELTAALGAVELVVAMLMAALLMGQALGRFEITAMLLIMIALGIGQDKAKIAIPVKGDPVT